MYCNVCGRDLDEKARFCSNCGAKVAAGDVESDISFSEENGFVSGNVEFEKEECEDSDHSKRNLDAARNIYFDWDLGCFPSEKAVSPEKVDFNWSSVVEEKSKDRATEDSADEIFSEEDICRGEPVSFDWGLGTTTRLDRTVLEEAEAESVTDVEELIPETEPVDDAEAEKRRIDKFYTFNKKNEEFQALLDQEYERLRQRIHEESEAEAAIASKYEKLEKARDCWEKTDIEPEENDVPEAEAAEESLLEEPAIIVNETEEKPVAYPALSEFFDNNGYTLEEGVAAIIQPIRTTVADVRENTHKECAQAQVKKNRIKYSDIFENDDIDEFKPEKRKLPIAEKKEYKKTDRKANGKKIFFDVLIVILAIIVVLASILLFAKDSVPAAYINKGIDKVVSVFTGAEAPAEGTVPSDVTTAMSEVIKAELSANKNIGTVREGANLGFAHDKDYGIDGFLESSAFTDSVWFTDDEGKTVNYGNIIVGNIISYYSQLVDFKNGVTEDISNVVAPESELYHEIKGLSKAAEKGYAIAALELGEIRTMGDRYFAMVQISETADKGQAENTSRKIVELISNDKTMNIVNIKDI